MATYIILNRLSPDFQRSQGVQADCCHGLRKNLDRVSRCRLEQ